MISSILFRKDVQKTKGTKLSALFIETTERIKEMLEARQPIRTGNWTTPEVELINEKLKELITTKVSREEVVNSE